MKQPERQPRFIYRQKPKPKPKNFGTWDLETLGLGGPFAGGVTFAPGHLQTHDSIRSVWETLINPPRPLRTQGRVSRGTFEWFAHNGTRYDFTYVAKLIADYAVEHDVVVETIQQGTKIISLVIPTPGGRVKISDSFPALGCSLDAASKVFAPERPKADHCPDHDFTKDDQVWWNPGCPVCVDYMIRDAETLYVVMVNFKRKLVQTFGVEPGLTMGSTAMRAFIAMIPRGHVYYRQAPDKEDFLRKFGCGSLTYPGCTSDVWLPEPGQEVAAITFDRSAAFGACMMEGGYPVSPGVWSDSYKSGELGFYEVEVTTALDLDFPFIPIYTEHGRKFAVGGPMTAYITSEMYEAGLAAGYHFTVREGLVFYGTADVFGRFIRKCQDFEYPPDGTDADPGIRLMAKGMRNSLNGKFNMNPKTERLYIGNPPADLVEDDTIEVHAVTDQQTGEHLPLYSITEDVDAPYIHPEWYALTTTRQILEVARLAMLLAPSQRGKIDTDSITGPAPAMMALAEAGHIPRTRGYGGWKIEHSWLWLQSLGVKNYMGDDLENGQVDYCKGIPRKVMKDNRRAHLLAASGVRVQLTFDSLRSTREMMELGLEVPGIQRIRSIGTPDTSNGWDWDATTHDFRPVRVVPSGA